MTSEDFGGQLWTEEEIPLTVAGQLVPSNLL